MPVDMDIRHERLPEQAYDFFPKPEPEMQREPITKAANVTFLTAALVASALIHGAAIYFWPERQAQGLLKTNQTDTPSAAIEITLRTKAPAPQLPTNLPPAHEPIKGVTPTQQATRASSSLPVNSRQATEVHEPLPAKSPAPLNLTPSSATITSPAQTSSRVFHPRLRQKINSTKTQRFSIQDKRGVNKHTWTNASRTTVVDLGYDGCLKSQAMQTRGVARDWYMSNCEGKTSAGEKMLSNMQRELDARNRKR